jgi:hypothetical protein
VEKFKSLGTTLKNRNSIQAEMKSRLKVGECFLSFGAGSSLLQFAIQKHKIKIYRTIILPVVLYECETWSFI